MPWLVPISLKKHVAKGSPSASGSSSVNGGNRERTLASTTGREALLRQARTSWPHKEEPSHPTGPRR